VARVPATSKDKARQTYRDAGVGMVVVVAAPDVERVLQPLGDETRLIGVIAKRGGGEAISYRRTIEPVGRP
jgi:phosphoribosylaminoimidazole (AIR) synthetase